MEKLFKWAGIISLGIAFAVIMLMTCNGCPGEQTVEQSAYDSILAERAEANRVYQMQIDSLNYVMESQDTIIEHLTNTKDLYKSIAEKQKQRADKYATLYIKAKGLLDTSVMIESCDSLINEYYTTMSAYESTQRVSDSVIMAQFMAIAIRDTTIKVQKTHIAKLESVMGKQDSAYYQLFNEYWRYSVKQEKRKKLTWIAAAAAFIAGVLIAK